MEYIDDDIRRMNHELRVVLKDNLYYIYLVNFYEDGSGFLLTPTLLTVPRASLEEFRQYINKVKEALDKPVIIS